MGRTRFRRRGETRSLHTQADHVASGAVSAAPTDFSAPLVVANDMLLRLPAIPI